MNSKYGLTAKELSDIVAVFRHDRKVERAILFGSRAKGNYRPGSDVDLAIEGRLTFDDFLSIVVRMESIDILQKVELVDLNTIQEQDLLDHIRRIGIVIYEREG